MSVSQKYIAESLNLSVATVCRALRGGPGAHPQTRKKVVKLASELGYRYRGAPRKQKNRYRSKKKLMSIGVLVAWPKEVSPNPSVAAYNMLSGVSEAVEDMGVTMATHFGGPDRYDRIADIERLFPAIGAGTLSGMVFVYGFPRGVIQKFARLLPCVTLHHAHLDIGADCVGNDQAGGMGMVVEHLYRLGHRRIGFVAEPEYRAWLSPRFSGYMEAMERLGLVCDPSITINVFEKNLDVEARADAVAEHSRRGVTAWVCADDIIGYDLYPRLTARGLRIPRDISLAGFSGLVPPHGDFPRLTSVHPPFERMGNVGVQQLLHRIQHPDEPVRFTQFACEFVEGETTGPPPQDQ
ncbi:MAG: LacI family transcriptional regulator [Phycisphaerae bacterium]|nr:LacI family transcriptional regulator [Phycisphaerae bacterium]